MAYIPAKRMTKQYMLAVDALWGAGEAQIVKPRYRTPKQTSLLGDAPRSVTSRRKIEQQMQFALVTWLKLINVEFLSIPNEGKRSPQEGLRLKNLGLRPGASDLFIAEPTIYYAGYWIELKSPGEKPRPNQIEFMDKMRAKGYKAEWFTDWLQAKYAIENYLNGNR